MHNRLFETPVQLERADFADEARGIGLDATEFQTCLGGQTGDRVTQDMKLARVLRLTGTPAFLIGHEEAGQVKVLRVIPGARPFSEFAVVLDEALAAGGRAPRVTR